MQISTIFEVFISQRQLLSLWGKKATTATTATRANKRQQYGEHRPKTKPKKYKKKHKYLLRKWSSHTPFIRRSHCRRSTSIQYGFFVSLHGIRSLVCTAKIKFKAKKFHINTSVRWDGSLEKCTIYFLFLLIANFWCVFGLICTVHTRTPSVAYFGFYQLRNGKWKCVETATKNRRRHICSDTWPRKKKKKTKRICCWYSGPGVAFVFRVLFEFNEFVLSTVAHTPMFAHCNTNVRSIEKRSIGECDSRVECAHRSVRTNEVTDRKRENERNEGNGRLALHIT